MNGRRVFRLFACCIPVRGARRSTICDLQRQSYRLIPNALYDLLTEGRDRTLPELLAGFDAEDRRTVEQYYAFLEENELGFWTDDPDAFPEMDLTWEAPERITNAVIDVGEASRHDVPSLLGQLDGLGCKMLQVRFFVPVAPDALAAVLAETQRGRLRTLELLLPWSAEWTPEALEALCEAHARISAVYLHGAPGPATTKARSDARIVHRTRSITSADHCGEVHPVYFSTNVAHFTEAQRHNTCLNRKIAVDEHGEIRNCPAHPRSYGNAADTPLLAAYLAEGFRDLWAVAKDQVDVCRDCEFRYVCTDCRVFVSDPADLHSKPARCDYDPYTAVWATPEPALAAAGGAP